VTVKTEREIQRLFTTN